MSVLIDIEIVLRQRAFENNPDIIFTGPYRTNSYIPEALREQEFRRYPTPVLKGENGKRLWCRYLFLIAPLTEITDPKRLQEFMESLKPKDIEPDFLENPEIRDSVLYYGQIGFDEPYMEQIDTHTRTFRKLDDVYDEDLERDGFVNGLHRAEAVETAIYYRRTCLILLPSESVLEGLINDLYNGKYRRGIPVSELRKPVIR